MKISKRPLASLVSGIVTLLLQSPVAATACPMCYGSSSSRVLDIYYLSTLLLSLLPFAIVAAIVAVGLHIKRQVNGLLDEKIQPSGAAVAQQ